MFKEITGDLFSNSTIKFADAICVTTNSIVKNTGRAVMGAGCALDAKIKFPDIDLKLGKLIKENGNIVQIILNDPKPILSFPTKTIFWEPSKISLIEKSLRELIYLTNHNSWTKVVLPRPGCNNGGLSWLSQIKPILEQILDERFYIISR